MSGLYTNKFTVEVNGTALRILFMDESYNRVGGSPACPIVAELVMTLDNAKGLADAITECLAKAQGGAAA